MTAAQLPQQLPYNEAAIKIGLSLGIGLLVGLEREWAQKEVGVRTFAIVCLIGTVASLVAEGLQLVSLGGVLLLISFVNVQSMLKDRSLEITTSAALIATLVLGVCVGGGHYFTAAASAILVTMLLAWKVELAKFADALQPEEIRGAVLLGLISFVIYPLLKDEYIDPYGLINPRQAWVTVVVIAGIGFVNYVLLRLYSTRGLYYAALLGGLVNSTAAVAELAGSLRGLGENRLMSRGTAVLLTTNVAMFVRNLVLLAIFASDEARAALMQNALPALLAMAALSALFTWMSRERGGDEHGDALHLGSPVSLKRVLKFGLIFLALASAGRLAQRGFGDYGFLAVALVGGLVSSASTTATAATLAAGGQVTPAVAGMGVVLTSMSSTLVNLPLVYQQTRHRGLTRRLGLMTAAILGLGLLALLITSLRRG